MILTRPRGLAATTPSTQQIQSMITQAANQYGVPPSLALSVAKAESSYNPNAVSPAGASGVMQLMGPTATMLGVTNVFDAQQNITGGVKYLSQLYNQYGDWNTALVAYNAGPGRVAAGTAPASSYGYASSILAESGVPATGASGGGGTPAILTSGSSDEVTAIYESDQPDVTLAGVGGGTLALILGGGAILILMMGRRKRSAS